MQILIKFQVNRIKIDDLKNLAMSNFWSVLTYWPKLTSKFIGGWIQWPDMQLLFKFQVNGMKIEEFRNLRKLTFGRCWSFDLLTSKTRGFLLMTNSTVWWSFVKIGLKLWLVGDWHTNRQTDKQTDRITHKTKQYTVEYWKNLRFSQVTSGRR